jgi:dienelactone hydrolase
MSQHVVLFHSALGLRPAVLDWSVRLRAAGHQVHTPDLFDAQIFSRLDDGIRRRDALGIPELIRRAQESVAGLPAGLVFAGFSMGAAPAELLAATRPGARAAILMHGALKPADMGVSVWPTGVPVQIHHAKEDPLVDGEAVRALQAAVKQAGARADVHTYPGRSHLFADDGLEDYDPTSAKLMEERVLAFLASLDREAT